MKILLIGPMPDPVTGVSFANEVFVKHLKKSQYRVDIINAHVGSGVFKSHGSLSFTKIFGFLTTYLSVYKIAFTNVLYLTPGQTFFGVLKYAPFMIIAKLLGKPYVFHLHGNYLGKQYAYLTGLKKIIFNYLISGSSAGIALSESLRQNFSGLLPDNKVFTLVNFVDDTFLSESKNNISGINLNCLFLSNLMEDKGTFDFLNALKILKQKNILFSGKVAGN